METFIDYQQFVIVIEYQLFDYRWALKYFMRQVPPFLIQMFRPTETVMETREPIAVLKVC